MKISRDKQETLRQLPGVDRLLEAARKSPKAHRIPKSVLLQAIRATLERQRKALLEADDDAAARLPSQEDLLRRVIESASAMQAPKLQHVINATGVVVHTNLGRSCLPPSAVEHVAAVAARYSNLEFDLALGRRGSRYSIVEALLCEISGAEAALVVNNNAGAVLLCLDSLAHGRAVIISRGELVEIGGLFRIPDVMAKSGAILKEVGSTNRTHLYDYEEAITDETALLLKVHASNYSIVGFTASVSLAELTALGDRFNIPVMEDLGSGNLIDLKRHGLPVEPTVQDSIAAGAHVVTFSGDKLLGGPQAGIIVGHAPIIERIKRNPLTRALRIDKFTLAALEATLSLYRDEAQAIAAIPTLAMLTAPKSEMEYRARTLKTKLASLNDPRLKLTLLDRPSKAGGGALPRLELTSCCVGLVIEGLSADGLEKALRHYRPPIIGRIENNIFLIDPRTLLTDEDEMIVKACQQILGSWPQPDPTA